MTDRPADLASPDSHVLISACIIAAYSICDLTNVMDRMPDSKVAVHHNMKGKNLSDNPRS